MDYLLHIIISIGIYIILSTSLNLIAGYTGLLSIAHAAFYGVGAYVVALMALNLDSNFMINIFCAIAMTAILGTLVGWPGLRIKDDYFVIATFGFQIIAFSVLNNLVSFTGGPIGLPGIPKPELFGYQISSHTDFLILVYLFVSLTLWVSLKIVQSPFGRMLEAVREDEIFAESVGKNVPRIKVLIFTFGAGMASIAGALYAYYVSFIDPTSFTVMESIFIISIVIIGGSGTLWGPVIGAIILVSIPEGLRFVGLPNSIAANVRQILYGGLLVTFMIWRPQGIFSSEITEFLKKFFIRNAKLS